MILLCRIVYSWVLGESCVYQACSFHIQNESLYGTGVADRNKQESVKRIYLSDLNNLEVVTTTSEKVQPGSFWLYRRRSLSCAGGKMGCPMKKETVRYWYDGFSLWKRKDIYNRGPLQNIWTRENMERTGQTPAEIC